MWGYGAGGTSTSLAGTIVSKAGGSGISDLTNIDAAPATPLRGLGQTFPGQAPHPFLFDWSNGDATASASAATAGLQHDGEATPPSTLGDGFSFTVPAGPATQILSVYVATNRADGTLTAHLSDGSAPDYLARRCRRPSTSAPASTRSPTERRRRIRR